MTDDSVADSVQARPRSRSVRFRITALAALLLAAVLAVAGVVLAIAHERLLISGVDHNLRSRADDIEQIVAAGGGTDGSLASAPDTIVQVVTTDGRVLTASNDLLEEVPLEPLAPDFQEIRTSSSIPVEDDDYRLLSRPIAEERTLHVATSIDDIQDSNRLLIAALATTVPLVVVVAAAIAWWLVGRTLKPVEDIRAEVAAMEGQDLRRRVPVSPTNDEVSRLAQTMNEMLDRFEEVSNRQRQFVADASHELRSPLARMRSELEVDLAHPEGADPIATHHSVLEEAELLQRTVNELLILARGEAQAGLSLSAVDLDDIVIHEAAALKSRSKLSVDVSGVSGAQVTGDALQLTRAVRNLIDNAAQHAHSRVTLTLSERDDVAEFAASDDGPGVPVSDHQRIFERFTRVDEARTRADGGTGLGLPISRAVAERHGGTLEIDPHFRGGARFVLTLPVAS